MFILLLFILNIYFKICFADSHKIDVFWRDKDTLFQVTVSGGSDGYKYTGKKYWTGWDSGEKECFDKDNFCVKLYNGRPGWGDMDFSFYINNKVSSFHCEVTMEQCDQEDMPFGGSVSWCYGSCTGYSPI